MPSRCPRPHGTSVSSARTPSPTRSLAHAGHYPSIDVLHSVSRLIGEIATPEVRDAGQGLRAALAAYREKEDLITVGAYKHGTDPVLDSVIALRPRIDAFLRQAVDERSALDAADAELISLAEGLARGSDPLGGVIDEAMAARSAALPARVPLGGPMGAPVAIPALQLTP